MLRLTSNYESRSRYRHGRLAGRRSRARQHADRADDRPRADRERAGAQAGITPQTASSHLAKLEAGGLIEPEKQGRHRYYRLTGPDVAGVLEGLAGLAERAGHTRVRTGPKEPALRRARICYDHLAGDLGVQMLDSMRKQRLVRQSKQAIELTSEGKRFMARRCRSMPIRWPIRAGRCARPASTGASGAITSPARWARP